MRVFFRQMFSGLLLAALASAPMACGDDSDDGSDVDAGAADAGAEVAPPTGSAVTTQPAAAGSQAGEQGARR